MRYILNGRYVDIEDLVMFLYDTGFADEYIRLIEIDTDKYIMIFERHEKQAEELVW